MYAYIYIYIYTYIYTFIHIYIHTHTHIYASIHSTVTGVNGLDPSMTPCCVHVLVWEIWQLETIIFSTARTVVKPSQSRRLHNIFGDWRWNKKRYLYVCSDMIYIYVYIYIYILIRSWPHKKGAHLIENPICPHTHARKHSHAHIKHTHIHT